MNDFSYYSRLQASGHPRNNLMTGSSFLLVERLGDDGNWIVVATDADWETKCVYFCLKTSIHTFVILRFLYFYYNYSS